MNKPVVRIAVLLAVLVGFDLWLSRRHATRPGGGPAPDATAPARPAGWRPGAPKPAAMDPSRRASKGATAADRAARVKDILRDYEEIQAKQSAEFSAAGTSFPGGLAAFLRQLALLDREKRADLAEAMTARELEDYEIRETAAGRHMREMLEGTAATDDQRRAVFRAELAFNDRFGFTFDLSPAALREREAARQTMETKIYGALGGTMFAAWLQRQDASYSEFVPLALRQGRPADFTLVELWTVRNDFMQDKLAIGAQPDDAIEQRQAAAFQAAQARIAALIGVAEAADPRVRRWLQQTPSAVPPAK